MKKYIILIVVITFISFLILIIWVGLNFSPGSYSDTPKYEFNVSEDRLLLAINKVKITNPTFNVPQGYEVKDGRNDANDHWYHFYLFYVNENELLNCWVRQSTTNSTKCTLAFVSIRSSNGKWHILTNDVDDGFSQKQKIIFEKRFIKPLKLTLNNKYKLELSK